MTFTPVRRHRLPGAELERLRLGHAATVTGNNLVKRTVTFAAVATDRIRINVTGALGDNSRLTEVEAWTTGGAGPAADDDRAREFAQPVDRRPVGHLHRDGHRRRARPATSPSATAPTTSAAAPPSRSPARATRAPPPAPPPRSSRARARSPPSTPATPATPPRPARSSRRSSTPPAAAVRPPTSRAPPTAAPRPPPVPPPATRRASLINGDTAGANWSTGGGWKDGTSKVFPDTVDIVFNGAKTIDRVVVYSIQDDYARRRRRPTR